MPEPFERSDSCLHLGAPPRGSQTLIYRWVCLGVLFLSAFLTFCIRLAPAVALPNLQATFGLTAAELSLLTALYLWPFAFMQPLAGLLTDVLGPRCSVTIFLTITGLGQLLLALAPNFTVALLGRACTGFGASILYVAAAKFMAQWFRRREFGTLTGVWTSVANLGGVAAAAPLAVVLPLIGWRASFGAIGLAILATALLVLIVVRDSPADLGWPTLIDPHEPTQSAEAGRPLSSWQGLCIVLREPNTWLLGGYAFLLFGTMTMMQGLWAVPYLMDIYGRTQQEAANSLTLWAVGLIFGCTLWGYVADRVVKTRKGVVCAGAVVYALLWVLLAVRPAGLPVGLLPVAMFWGGFFASTWIPAYAQLKDSVPPQVIATAMGMLNLFFWLGGAFYQQITGLLLEAFPKQAGHIPLAGYRTLFWFCLGSVSLSVILSVCSKEQSSRGPIRRGIGRSVP
jgi:sugar phosphate permease